jgi:hypothetical protein
MRGLGGKVLDKSMAYKMRGVIKGWRIRKIMHTKEIIN